MSQEYKKHSNEIINGRNRVIYTRSGSKAKYIKNKGNFMRLSEYKKMSGGKYEFVKSGLKIIRGLLLRQNPINRVAPYEVDHDHKHKASSRMSINNRSSRSSINASTINTPVMQKGKDVVEGQILSNYKTFYNFLNSENYKYLLEKYGILEINTIGGIKFYYYDNEKILEYENKNNKKLNINKLVLEYLLALNNIINKYKNDNDIYNVRNLIKELNNITVPDYTRFELLKKAVHEILDNKSSYLKHFTDAQMFQLS